MADQLFLFNLIDGSPAVPIEVAPVAVRPVAPPAPKLKPQPAAQSWKGDLKLLDMVKIQPFTDAKGKEHGGLLDKPGVIVGFNESAQMVEVDVGTLGSNRQVSPWRLVKIDG